MALPDNPFTREEQYLNRIATGDKVHYPTAEDEIWISTVNDNVWQPGVYGWEIYKEN